MKKNILIILSLSIITFTLISMVLTHGHHHHNNKKDKHNDINSIQGSIINSHITDDDKHHHHVHLHGSNTIEFYFQQYIQSFSAFLQNKLSQYSKKEQSYIGAMIVSSASIPIFLIILILKIRNVKLLDAMSAFASGALLADVILHNLPEIFKSDEGDSMSSDANFFQKKEIYICIGVITLFAIEKIVGLLTSESKNNKQKSKPIDNKSKNIANKNKVNNIASEYSDNDHYDHNHGHSHAHSNGNLQNIIISFLGDFVHNVTDGIAIGAAYGTSNK